MTSPLTAIFARIDTRLAAIEGVQSYQRMPSGDPDRFPAIEAYDNGDEPVPDPEVGVTRLGLMLTVAGYVETGGAIAHDALIALHAAAVQVLCGDEGSDLGLPGMVELIEIVGRRRVDIAELAKKRRLGFEQDFLIQYSTVRGDPSQPA
ncbi:MAG TPA: hypothetical protein VGO55_03190 [Allosphingosinicella sp.]|jgi:hypothetical protein|nr:hypothetical protein [Allosphingosinicella sp.]